MELVWISFLCIGIFIDIVTSGVMFAMISLGALVALILNLAGASINIQISVAMVISLVGLFVIAPYLRKKIFRSSNTFVVQEERAIGRQLVLEKSLKKTLQISLDGSFWVIESDVDIEAGSTVEIVGLKGNKYIVKEIKV